MDTMFTFDATSPPPPLPIEDDMSAMLGADDFCNNVFDMPDVPLDSSSTISSNPTPSDFETWLQTSVVKSEVPVSPGLSSEGEEEEPPFLSQLASIQPLLLQEGSAAIPDTACFSHGISGLPPFAPIKQQPQPLPQLQQPQPQQQQQKRGQKRMRSPIAAATGARVSPDRLISMANGSLPVDVKLSIDDERELKKQRRMIKNRESAQRSRQKRKDQMDELELNVAKLKEANLKLTQRNKFLEEKVKKLTDTIAMLRGESSSSSSSSAGTAATATTTTKQHRPSTSKTVQATSICMLIVLFSFGLYFNVNSGGGGHLTLPTSPFMFSDHHHSETKAVINPHAITGRMMTSFKDAALPLPFSSSSSSSLSSASGSARYTTHLEETSVNKDRYYSGRQSDVLPLQQMPQALPNETNDADIRLLDENQITTTSTEPSPSTSLVEVGAATIETTAVEGTPSSTVAVKAYRLNDGGHTIQIVKKPVLAY